MAIDVLLKISINVFVDEISEEKQTQMQKKLNEVAGKKKTADGLIFF
jgi:hypothetical protein